MSSSGELGERTGFEVAILGAACRVPGARSVEEFWDNLCAGRDTIRRFSREELIAAGRDPGMVEMPNYVPVFPAIGDLDQFDASFFNYSPREAEILDPQGRLLLEAAWQALEDAGYDPDTYEGLVGAFSGGRLSTYMMQIFRNPEAMARVGEFQLLASTDKDYLSPRLSYKLNLGGPSVTVQTACSTSLVAVHLACQALLGGECDLALAGGVSAKVPEEEGYVYRPGEVASKTGVLRAFDADADGTIFGNGVGMVVLKRLEDALADRDRVLAVIKGSAVANDADRRVGFTAPGTDGQQRVIRAAQIAAEVDADSISYVEAHATGTSLGDPIEVDALTKAFRETTSRSGYCALGSVKSNVGHLSAAAGVAGLIKTVLALRERKIPPSIHFERPNPQIDFESSPFFVNTELRDWEAGPGPRRAAVSAFGIGGTNAHVILEEAPAPEPTGPSHRSHQLLAISARTPSALDAATGNLAEHLRAHPEQELPDVAFTLHRGRRAFEQRRFVVCRDTEDAVSVLRGGHPERLLSGAVPADRASVVFMFSGQGSQYPGMGAGLYRDEPVFRAAVDRCAEILRPHLAHLAQLAAGKAEDGLDLRDLLYPDDPTSEEAAARLAQTAATQPALFTVEYALAQLWRSWGVEPRAMIGHSIGEYVAACLAGVLSLEDALALVAARGRLMQDQAPGDMLAVSLGEDELADRLSPELSLAALNAPGRSVVSGPADAVAALAGKLEADGVACRPLHTSHAFHSQMMESMLAPFVKTFAEVELRAPEIPYVSNLTGTWIAEDEATDPGYWARHLRHAVRFADGLETLSELGDAVYLEVGPGKSLASLARQNRSLTAGKGSRVIPSMSHPKDATDDEAFVLDALGRLWLAGLPVDWRGFYEGEERRRVPLPTYPFERRSYWIEATQEGLLAGGPIKKADLGDWFNLPSWQPSVTPDPGDEAAAGDWLFFVGPDPTSGALAEALAEEAVRQSGEEAERRVVTVELGGPEEGLAALGKGRYRVGSTPEALAGLFEALERDGVDPRRLVHLGGVGDAPADLETTQELGFWSLLALAKALGRPRGSAGTGGKDRAAGGVRLAVVTSGVQQVAGEAVSHPERATVLGPGRVIPQEIPGVAVAAFDVEAPADAAAAAGLAGQLADELAAGLPDGEVAYRGSRRWVRDFHPVHLGPPRGDGLRLRQGGTYLITGGLGGLGRAFAELLAREHGARLILLDRAPLPPREEWDRILGEAGAGDRAEAHLRAVRELEAQGAEVLALTADVSDPESLEAALRRSRERFGALHGVIHAAGAVGGGMIQLKTREAARTVLAPKVQGTLALERAIEAVQGEKEPLDFLILCSSTLSHLGGFGQVDHCAADSFLDAFARSRFRPSQAAGGTYTVALDWGAWSAPGSDPGRAVEGVAASASESPATLFAVGGMSPAEGAEALSRVLARGRHPQVVITPRDLHDLLRQARAPVRLELGGEATGEAPAGHGHPRPEIATPYVAPSHPTEAALAAVWASVLGIEKVGVHDNFFELGGDSILGIQVITKAGQRGLTLSPGQLFELQTVAELAAAVAPEEAVADRPVEASPYQRELTRELTRRGDGAESPPRLYALWAPAGREPLDEEALAAALATLVEGHPVLSLDLGEDGNAWEPAAPEAGEGAARVPLRRLEGEWPAEADEILARVRSEGVPEVAAAGSVPLAALRLTAADGRDRLVLAADLRALDETSLRLLAGELEAAYDRLAQGGRPEPPAVDTGFTAWIERLAALELDVDAEVEGWLQGAAGPAAERPEAAGAWAGEPGPFAADPDREVGEALVTEVAESFRATVGELVLAAVTEAVRRRSGAPAARLWVEADGREIASRLDLGLHLDQSVGCFACGFPLRLAREESRGGKRDAEGAADLAAEVQRTKTARRGLPSAGLSFGLLKHRGSEAEAARLAELERPWLAVVEAAGPSDTEAPCVRGPRPTGGRAVEARSRIEDGRLRLEWAFDESAVSGDEVRALAEATRGVLGELVEAAHSSGGSLVVPEDFPDADLSADELAAVMSKIGG